MDKEENQYEYEYEYEYENDYSEDLNETNSESENKNEDSEISDSNNNNDNDITIIKNDSVDSNDESIQRKSDTDNDDDEIKIRMPSNKYGNRSPKRNLRRAPTQNLILSSNKSQNGSLSNINDNSEPYQNESDFQSAYNESDYYSNYSYEYDLYDYYDDENGEKKFHKRKRKHKRKHTHKNHSQKNHENENSITNNVENNSKHNHFKIGSKNKNKSKFETDKKSLSNTSSFKNENKKAKSKTKNNINNNHEQDQKLSTRIHNQIDHRTKMNLLLVNSYISEAYNNTNNKIDEQNKNYRSNQKDFKSNSSLDRKIFLKNQNQGPMIKIKATRRFPTPLGYHFVHPGLSLYERSLKPRRPRTPDKRNNGLIISRSVVPTNIILDATALDDIIESDDTRYRPLLNQIRPLLRSHYYYYSEKMRNLNRIHAFFNLNIMLPVYQRNRQQIQNQIKELSRITNIENKNEILKNSSFIVPPIKIEELSMNENQPNLKSKKERKNDLSQSEKPSTNRNCIFQNVSKPRSLLEIGKIRHSYDNKNIYSTRTKINAVSPRIYRLNKNKLKRKASCPPRIHQPIILSPLPQTERNNNADSEEYNKFISSLCNQKDRRVLHRKQKSLSVDLPSNSLYVTGKLIMHESSKYQRIHQVKNNEDNKTENNDISTNE